MHMKALLKGIQLTSGGLAMFDKSEEYEGFDVGFGDIIGSQEIGVD